MSDDGNFTKMCLDILRPWLDDEQYTIMDKISYNRGRDQSYLLPNNTMVWLYTMHGIDIEVHNGEYVYIPFPHGPSKWPCTAFGQEVKDEDMWMILSGIENLPLLKLKYGGTQ